MWRSFFLAIGFTVFLLGLECLAVDKAVLRTREEASNGILVDESPEMARREFTPSDRTAWTLISAGAVVMIYSFTIPQRVNS